MSVSGGLSEAKPTAGERWFPTGTSPVVNPSYAERLR
jgi:hypothetical protein